MKPASSTARSRFSGGTGRHSSAFPTGRPALPPLATLLLALVLASVLAFTFAPAPAAQTGPSRPAAAPPPAVEVETVAPGALALERRFIGEVVSPAKVQLVARVEGFLGPRTTGDGASVKKGDVLFTVEDAPYRAALAEAEAALASATAAETLAEATLERSKALRQRGTVSDAQLQTDQAAHDRAVAETAAARAKVDLAGISLGYTTITAPMDGRLGIAAVAPGAFVPASGQLALLVATDPMRVHFPVPQRTLLDGRLHLKETGGVAAVALVLANGTTYGDTGRILFADVVANPRTDAVTLVAEIANPDGVLLDGQVVTVLVSIPADADVLTVPQSAILRDQQGPYALTVGADGTVGQARIVLGDRSGARVEVTGGLSPGDRVVVSGQLKVRLGQAVTAHEARSGTAPAPAAD